MAGAHGSGTLLQAFRKFCDEAGQQDHGAITLKGFRKAFAHLGIRLSDDEADEIFSHFDPNHDGKINFKEFSRTLFTVSNMVLNTHDHLRDHAKIKQDRVNAFSKQAIEAKTPQELLAKLKEKMSLKRNQFEAFSWFRKLSGSSDSTLTMDEFSTAIDKAAIFASPEVKEGLFKKMDPDTNNKIDFNEFVVATLGKDSKKGTLHRKADNLREMKLARAKKRAAIQETVQTNVDDPFLLLQDKMQQLSTGSHGLLAAFQRFKHESNTSGDKNYVSFKGFRSALDHINVRVTDQEAKHLFDMCDPNHDGHIDFQEFTDAIFGKDEMVIDSHDYVKEMAALRDKRQKAYADNFAKIRTGGQLLKVFRDRMEREKNYTKGFQRFRNLANSDTNTLTLPQFIKGMRAYNVNATDTACEELFSVLDPDNSETIDFKEFVTGVLGSDGDKGTLHRRVDHVRKRQMEKAQKRAEQQQEVVDKKRKDTVNADPLAHIKKVFSLTSKTEGALKQAFSRFRINSGIGNTGKGNAVDYRGFLAATKQFGVTLEDEDAKAIFEKLDANGDGSITFQEFSAFLFEPDNMVLDSHDHTYDRAQVRKEELAKYAAMVGSATTAGQLMTKFKAKLEKKKNILAGFEEFRKLSGSTDNLITLPEFKQGLSFMQLNATPHAMEALFRELDPNNSLTIDYNEFVKGILVGDEEAGSLTRTSEHNHHVKEKEKEKKIARKREIDRIKNRDPVLVIRETIAATGKGGMPFLRSAFRRFKVQGHKGGEDIVDKFGFRSAIRQFGCDVKMSEIDKVYHRLDTNNDGVIDFNEFVAGLFKKKAARPKTSRRSALPAPNKPSFSHKPRKSFNQTARQTLQRLTARQRSARPVTRTGLPAVPASPGARPITARQYTARGRNLQGPAKRAGREIARKGLARPRVTTANARPKTAREMVQEIRKGNKGPRPNKSGSGPKYRRRAQSIGLAYLVRQRQKREAYGSK